MHVVVTGGNGLVGANLSRRILAKHPTALLSVIDLAPPDELVLRYLEPFSDRVSHLNADLRDPLALDAVSDQEAVTHVIHAAAIAHATAWELEDPRRFFDVNLGGTINVVRWARRLPQLRRLLHVSTGGVYGTPGALSPESPQPEDGPFDPPEVYAISKFAAEWTARRLGAMYGLDVRAIRLSGVFGPLERPTAGRTVMSLPYAVARSIIERRALCVTERTMRAGGDFLSAEDVAIGATAVLTADLASDVYNIAFGRFTPVVELFAATTACSAAFRIEIVEPDAAEIDMDPDNRRARWNAYAIARISSDTGWTPRPLATQIADYLRWIEDDVRRSDTSTPRH